MRAEEWGVGESVGDPCHRLSIYQRLPADASSCARGCHTRLNLCKHETFIYRPSSPSPSSSTTSSISSYRSSSVFLSYFLRSFTYLIPNCKSYSRFSFSSSPHPPPPSTPRQPHLANYNRLTPKVPSSGRYFYSTTT